MWKKKYPDMDLKPVIKRRIRGPGTVARLLTMSHRIVMNDAFSDGRSWPGVRVYALRESAPPRRRCEAPGPHSPDCEAVLTAASFSQVEHAKTEDERLAEILQGESLNQAIARVYAELVDETMRLNKVMFASSLITSRSHRSRFRRTTHSRLCAIRVQRLLTSGASLSQTLVHRAGHRESQNRNFGQSA